MPVLAITTCLVWLTPRAAAAGIKGLKSLCVELRVWEGAVTRVASIGLATVMVSQRQKNLELLRQFHEFPVANWEPVEGAVPFHRSTSIMNVMPLSLLRELPRGDCAFFPFATANALSGGPVVPCSALPRRHASEHRGWPQAVRRQQRGLLLQ